MSGTSPTFTLMMTKKIPLGLFQGGLFLYFVLFYYLTQAMEDWGNWGLVAMEGLLLATGLSLYSWRDNAPLHRGSRKENILLAIFVPLLIYPILLLANGVFLSLLANLRDLEDASSAFTGRPLGLGVLFFYGVLPALGEEYFFRGGLFQVYRRYGDRYSLWMTSLLFALFHFHIQNFIVPFLLGLALGYIVLYTGRVVYAILGHMVANVAGLVFRLSLSKENIAWLRSLGLVKKIGSFESSLLLVLLLVSLLCGFVLTLILSKKEVPGKLETRAPQDTLIYGSLPLLFIVVFYCYQVL